MYRYRFRTKEEQPRELLEVLLGVLNMFMQIMILYIVKSHKCWTFEHLCSSEYFAL